MATQTGIRCMGPGSGAVVSAGGMSPSDLAELNRILYPDGGAPGHGERPAPDGYHMETFLGSAVRSAGAAGPGCRWGNKRDGEDHARRIAAARAELDSHGVRQNEVSDSWAFAERAGVDPRDVRPPAVVAAELAAAERDLDVALAH